MSTTHVSVEPTVIQSLFTLVKSFLPEGVAPTLAHYETAVQHLFRPLGPELIETALHDAAPPEAAKKGGHRSVRVGSPCATTRSAPASSPLNSATSPSAASIGTV
jgi:hypothetical protein